MTEATTIVDGPPGSTPSPNDWLIKELKNLSPEARELFEDYSKIPSDKVVSHITQFRDKAFKVYPYPCLGHWGFLDLSIRMSPQYDEILQRIKGGDKYLDIGCCVGQDIRKLVSDGAPSENTYGSDLQQDFLEIGYDLFLDKSTLKATFIGADIFDPSSGLKELESDIDIIHTASFFHLFNWDEQFQVGKRVAELLKPKPGSLLVGRQIGHRTAGEWARRFDSSKTRYRHNEESFARLWKEVGDVTGSKWEVEAKLDEHDVQRGMGTQFDFVPEGTRWLRFTVRRV